MFLSLCLIRLSCPALLRLFWLFQLIFVFLRCFFKFRLFNIVCLILFSHVLRLCLDWFYQMIFTFFGIVLGLLINCFWIVFGLLWDWCRVGFEMVLVVFCLCLFLFCGCVGSVFFFLLLSIVSRCAWLR